VVLFTQLLLEFEILFRYGGRNFRSCITLTGAMAATADVSSISVPKVTSSADRHLIFWGYVLISRVSRGQSGKRKTDTKQI